MTTGFCKFCGQSVQISNAYADAEEAQKELQATKNCSCPEAFAFQKKAEQVEKAKMNVDILFGENAVENGFQPVEDDYVMELLKKGVEMVGGKSIYSMTISMPWQGTGKVSAGANGKIVVSRKVTNSGKLETAER